MIALFFACLIACIFAGIAMLESERGAIRKVRFGLIGWLTSGNWPAKLGGGLLIVGVGALLRYALLHVNTPPIMKLMGGGAISFTLFAVAHLVRVRFGKREVAIALAGAAFGVAYLTSYSAYALFHYLDGFTGLVLLAAVAVGAGMYAMSRNAVSLALLAMFGAFIAPAFALDHPQPSTVYGYYIAISQLTLIMVAMRGWRALIHLSFIFTLAGGLFFGWTASFYAPQFFNTMQVLLLVLIAIHIAMPIVEQRSPLSKWLVRFDRAYFVALPAVGAILLISIAPSTAAASAALLLCAGLWAIAAVVIRMLKLSGVLRHAVVGVLLAGVAAYMRTPELPWFLIAEALATLSLFIVYRVPALRNYQNAAVGGVLVSAGFFAASTLGLHPIGTAFLNQVVIERLASGVLAMFAWLMTQRHKHSLAPLLGWFAAAELVNTMAVELYRWNFDSWPILLHGATVVAALVIATFARYRTVQKIWVWLLSLAMIVTSVWASADSNALTAAIFMLITPLSLIALSLRADVHDDDYSNVDRVLGISLAPMLALMWAQVCGQVIAHQSTMHFALSVAIFVGVIALTLARLFQVRSERWIDSTTPLFTLMFSGVLIFSTMLSIHRGFWPVMLELMSLAGCAVLLYYAERGQSYIKSIYAVTTIGTVLVAQAMLLRVLGPDRVMTLMDVFHLHYPAVISLFWSALGAGLTLFARRTHSRTLWSTGAAVLVACAAKLMLLDFGSLGELTNILAVIAAGLVFLLVSWLAPLPPKIVDDQV